MTYIALVPVKALSEAKSRLADHLSQHQRENLVLDMLHHVIQILRESSIFDMISVVSPDHRVLDQAYLWGAQPLTEKVHGHNTALHAAALRIQVEHELPPQALLTISADLPLLHPREIHMLIERSQHYPVVLAPSREGTGTNALLVRPPLAVPYLFGPHSLQSYLYTAKQHQLSSSLCHSIGLALDIDTIDDLDDAQELHVLGGEQSLNLQLTTYSPSG